MLGNKRNYRNEKSCMATREQPLLAAPRESPHSATKTVQPKFLDTEREI